MKKFAMIFSLCSLVSLVFVSGCGGQKLPDGMPNLYPTTITLTVDGKPFTGGLITLVPVSGTLQWQVAAPTDERGKAVIRTHGEYIGAPEGEMKVCVSAIRNEEGPTAATPRPNDYGEGIAWDAAVLKERETFLVAGKEYGDAATTPLTMTIKKGKNEATFDVPEDGTQIKFAE